MTTQNLMSAGFGDDYSLFLTMRTVVGTEIKLTVGFKVYATVRDREEDSYKQFEPTDIFKLDGKTL